MKSISTDSLLRTYIYTSSILIVLLIAGVIYEGVVLNRVKAISSSADKNAPTAITAANANYGSGNANADDAISKIEADVIALCLGLPASCPVITP